MRGCVMIAALPVITAWGPSVGAIPRMGGLIVAWGPPRMT